MRCLFVALFLCLRTAAQVPFQLMLEPVGATLPGLHSYAKAQYAHYWLLVGGRVDGLHSMFPASAFSVEEQNHHFIVVDTTDWSLHWSPLHLLPPPQRFALAATNQQFYQHENKLYVIGGYGYDSLADLKRTFPILSVLQVDALINEIVNGGTNTAAYVRHLSDTFFAVTGGRLEMLDSIFFLIGGQYFAGQYTKLPSELFTQRYTNSVCRFQLDDDGTTITLKNVFCYTDTALLHRRDLNSCGWFTDDGQPALAAYGGVFRYDADLPYRWPVYFTADSLWVDTTVEQQFSQYTCPVICLYDSLSGIRYTVFFAGISLYDYDPLTASAMLDTLVPFIDDLSVLIRYPDGTTQESILPLTLPYRGLANAEFFPFPSVPRYANGVIPYAALTGPTLLGYLYGGINSSAPNFGFTYASPDVWRVWLDPGTYTATDMPVHTAAVLFADGTLWLTHPDATRSVTAYNLHGQAVQRWEAQPMQQKLMLDELPNGYYVLHIRTRYGKQALPVVRMH